MIDTIDDPIFYDPSGHQWTCRELVNSKGGWDNIGAEEAAALSEFGCGPQLFYDEQNNIPIWSGPQMGQEGRSAAPAVDLSPGDRPLWTGPETEVEPVTLGEFFTGSDIETNPIEFAGFTSQGTVKDEILNMLENFGRGALVGAGQQIEAGITETSQSGLACWRPTKSGTLSKRAQVRIRRDPATGVLQVQKYCRPKRMNPCNARALGRAARRLGMFQRMSAGVEKIINRQLKRKASRRPSFTGGSCGTRKRGC